MATLSSLVLPGDVLTDANTATLTNKTIGDDLKFADSDESNWVALQAASTVASDVTWTLPDADGTDGQFLKTNGSGTLSWASGGGGSSITAGDSSVEVTDTGSDGTITFDTDGSERMRIDSAGDVGIGTTAPSTALHILRSDSTSYSPASAPVAPTSSDLLYLQNPDDTTDGYTGIYFRHKANDVAWGRFALQGNFFGSPQHAFVFTMRGTSGASNNEKFRIFNNGAISFLGYTSPSISGGSSGEVYFPNIGTTASAANAFLNSGSSPANQLLRSTSSLRYKTSIENIDSIRADSILNFRPVWYRSIADADRKDWSWYGLIAEEVAEIEPRLVHWTYLPDAYEEVTKNTVDENGNEVLDDEGNVMPYTEKVLKADAEMVPDGVQYDRLTVLLLDVVKRQNERIETLEAKVAALENQP